MVSPFIYTVAAQKRIIEFGWQGQYAIYRIKQLHQTPRLNVLVWWCFAWVVIWVRKKQRPYPPTLLQRRLLYA